LDATAGAYVLAFNNLPSVTDGSCFKFRIPCNITTVATSGTPLQATVAVNKYEETIILYLSERFSDYKSKKKSNKKLMFLENADMAKRSIPEPICVEDVFK
jgi:hypothetical protein